MSKDPIVGVDERLVDERIALFRHYEKASMKCFFDRGVKIVRESSASSFAEMKALERRLGGVRQECHQYAWSKIKQAVGQQVMQMEQCFHYCLSQRSKLTPAFVRTPDCRYKCYEERSAFFDEYIKQAQQETPM